MYIKCSRLYTLLLLILICAGCSPKYENGDIIFQSLESSQSAAINNATASNVTHVGIVFIKENKKYVYEAVGPVRLIPLNDWIKQGKDSRYAVKRYKEKLTESQVKTMYNEAIKHKGKPYDFLFLWEDNKIYCSELIWKIYASADIKISKLYKFSDYNLNSKAVQDKIKERYGNIPLPADEPVVSPADLFRSDKLKLIYSNLK